ncbi:MAG: molybdopterin-dependent oxidoreductase [Desulfatiglandaceae bacterium]|jgi:DMSO/TMAO reductase YedYZ molybdopterin-dependent catalytic subunit
MENRRKFLQIMLKCFTGFGLLLSPLFHSVRVVYGKAKRIILPKGTEMESLVDKNPAELDTRNLETIPLKEFRTMGLSNQAVNLKDWRLEVTGRVKKPLSLTYAQLLAKPAFEKDVLLICPGFFANYGRWKGISLGRLLAEAGMEKGVTQVSFSGPENEYEKVEAFPLEDVLSNKVFLAYGVNGKTLPKKHGFPLRVVAEDLFGFRWVKYVFKVKVV